MLFRSQRQKAKAKLWKNLLVKRSMVATIEAPRVGPWQIGRIQTSNDKIWTMRLGTRRLRSIQDPMSGLELAQKITEELASPSNTHENNPLSVRKRKARHWPSMSQRRWPSTSQRREVEDLGCEIRTLILTSKTATLGQEHPSILSY